MNNINKNKRKNCKTILENIPIKVKKLKKIKMNNKI